MGDRLCEYAMEFVATWGAELVNEKVVSGVHIYTMNNEKVTVELLKRLSILCKTPFVNKEYVRLNEENSKEIKQSENTISHAFKLMIVSTIATIVARRFYRKLNY